ncbi:hypothetical protein BG015_005342 [Linnemannia schmuckeri]|uniref:F-box domain-containing protein n=1 Tax=Linnemannia schmuckeri TaxID=64567 RepID=A0A9P5S0R5_9FUNG|nr:hypothetical protein BG015_005342 [Linnemannia schmuckeri]
MLYQMWLWPEILYHLSEHLTYHELSRLSLVCHAWNNAFAPILWANITLGCQGRCRGHVTGGEGADRTPSLKTLQARASWIRSIAYHGHRDPHQFLLGPQCRYLHSLALRGSIPFNTTATPQFDKAYSDSCRDLIRQNRTTLRHLTLTQMTFNTPKNRIGVPNWSPMRIFAFGKYTDLRTLNVEWCYVYGQHREALWALCGRLEGLTIWGGSVGLPEEVWNRRQLRDKVNAAISSSADDNNNNSAIAGQEITEKWITSKRFPRMVELNISVSERCAEDYLHCIVAQCPRLRRLEWNPRSTTTLFVDLMLEYLTNPKLRATTWPDLECIGRAEIFGQDHLLQLIETWPVGKLLNVNGWLFRATDVMVKRLLDLHSNSLREVDMSLRKEASSWEWMHRFLELCPMLEKVKCQAINLQPLVLENRPPWVCERLQEWEIWIDMDPRSFVPPMILDNGLKRQEEWCRKVFERLGRFRQLRVLDLSWKPSEMGYYGSTRTRKETLALLHFSLRTGLDEMSKLSKLKEVYFQGQQTMLRRSDVRWMVKHWINLEVIQGGSFSEKREPFGGKKKKVWDFEYCRMFEQHHIRASSEFGPYPSDYLNPKQLARLAEADDE